MQSRSVEKEQRRLHVPLIDRSYGEPAPFVVLVHGPPQVSDIFHKLMGILCYSLGRSCGGLEDEVFGMIAGWEISPYKVSCKALYETQHV